MDVHNWLIKEDKLKVPVVIGIFTSPFKLIVETPEPILIVQFTKSFAILTVEPENFKF